MKGEILHYDDNAGTGQISGADGIRYSFTRADMKQLIPIGRGTRVDFDFEGKAAHDIYVDMPDSAAVQGGPPSNAAPAAAQAGAPAGEAEPALSLWGYFIRAYTARFARFSGRARRKEYWAVALFTTLFFAICMALIFVGLVGRRLGGTDIESLIEAVMQSPLSTIGALLMIVFALVSILPFAGLIFRRVHDIGWSGWIAALLLLLTVVGYVIAVVSTVAGVAILIVALIPGKPGANRYGPSPRPV